MMPDFKKQNGFTVFEMLIVSVIIIIIMSVVFANYRSGQQFSELELAFRQVSNAITTARTKSLGGEIFTGGPFFDEFPAGGYGVHFDNNSNQFTIYAADSPDTSLTAGDPIGGGVTNFTDVRIVELCGYDQATISGIPCDPSWTNLGSYLEVVFSQSNESSANHSPVGETMYFVGGLLEHQRSGEQAYFYISIPNGVVSSNFSL